MKKTIFSALFLLFAFSITTVTAQKFRPVDKSPLDVATYPNNHKDAKTIKVYYSRPYLKGRSVASLAPNGKVWRTGANEAVEIRFYEDVKFGGKKVAAGIYTLFTIPGDNEWTVILSNHHNAWGAYSYNEAKDVVRVKGTVSKNNKQLENFSMAFKDNMDLVLGWGNLLVTVPISK